MRFIAAGGDSFGAGQELSPAFHVLTELSIICQCAHSFHSLELLLKCYHMDVSLRTCPYLSALHCGSLSSCLEALQSE